ncbi:MAG: Inositol 2-dehydrogenase/D-chiro-inositol 3-dehydrogenase [Myxococcota bacterium]|nr:Inositol 2-dehydrogenase/D-chiro-inositol 3-dehydrogenase [Myxococcota bacterium]
MSSPVKVAVFGCGYWGKNLVRNMKELGALAAVVDPSEGGRKTAAGIAPDVPVHETPDAVLRDPSIQGVVVATPAETHMPMVNAAVDAGKDVLCEKPLALRYEDARFMARNAEEKDRILMVGHILEYHPAVLKLQELIREGVLGKVQYIYSSRLNLGKIRTEENILWSFAPHDIAVILRLVGAAPFQVICAGGSYLQPNIADVTVTQLLFDNGVAAHVFVSWLNPFKEQKLVVIGSQRMVTFDDVRKELMLHDQRVDWKAGEPAPVKGEGRLIEYAADEPLKRECRAFLEAIATRKPPITDSASALRVLRVLQASQRSLVTQGHPVMLPLD